MFNPSRYVQALVWAQQNARPLPEYSCQLSEKSLGFVRCAKWQNGFEQEFIPANKNINVCFAAHEFIAERSSCRNLICAKYCLKNQSCFELHSGIELLLCKTVKGLQIFHHYKRQFASFSHCCHISHCSLSQVKGVSWSITTAKMYQLNWISGETERSSEICLKCRE